MNISPIRTIAIARVPYLSSLTVAVRTGSFLTIRRQPLRRTRYVFVALVGAWLSPVKQKKAFYSDRIVCGARKK